MAILLDLKMLLYNLNQFYLKKIINLIKLALLIMELNHLLFLYLNLILDFLVMMINVKFHIK